MDVVHNNMNNVPSFTLQEYRKLKAEVESLRTLLELQRNGKLLH